MKTRNIVLLSSALLFSTAYGAGISFGPFDLRFGGENFHYAHPGFHRAQFEDTICRAISQQKQLEFTVVSKEKINAGEMKMVTNRVVVDPYAFGFTNDGQPVLRGTVVEEKLIKEVTIKLGEDLYPADDKVVKKEKNEEEFSGVFRSHKSKDNIESINLEKIRDVRVIEASHFDAPKDIDTIFKDDIAQVVCQVTRPAK